MRQNPFFSRTVFLLALSAALMLGVPSQVNASIKSAIELSPAFLEIDTSKLEDGGYPVTITNNTSQYLEVKTKYVPFTPSKDHEGTLEFHTSEQSVIQAVISISSEEFFVEGGETKVIYLIPSKDINVLRGDYYEALVFDFGTVDSNGGGGAAPIKETSISSAMAIPILMRNNPNATAKYSISSKDAPEQVSFQLPKVITMEIENMGNTYGTPRGEVEFRDVFGRLLSFGTINADSKRLLPSSRKSLSVSLRSDKQEYPLYLGTYSVRLRDEKQGTRASVVFSKKFVGVDPIFALGGLFGFVVFIIVFFLRYAHRRRAQ